MTTCAECSGMGLDCCKIPPGQDANRFGLTMADILRICRACRLMPWDFARVDMVLPSAKAKLYEVHPGIERMFPSDVRIFFKFDRAGGHCHFWTEKGCTLGPAKPRMCSLYPAWFYEEDGEGEMDLAAMGSACLVVQRVKSTEELVRAFWGTEKNVTTLAHQFHLELEEHALLTVEQLRELYATGRRPL